MPLTQYDGAEADLQRRQQRLSNIASAAKAEVVQLRSERGQLADQLRQLASAVGELSRPPPALMEAQTSAMRCLEGVTVTQGAVAHV